MAQPIKFYRSSSTVVTEGVTSLDFGTPAFTDVGGVRKLYIGDSSNVAREVGSAVSLGDWKDSVRWASDASIADLSSVTVADPDGQGQGVTLVEGDRVLVKDTASADGVEAVDAKRNGIYVVGTVTTGTAPLTRAEDANVDAEVTNGMAISSVNAGVNAGKWYRLTTADPITLDTTGLSFSEQAGQAFTAGDGIDILGGVITVDITDLLGTGIEDDGANNFRLATQGNGIAGGGGTTLSVNADSTGGANLGTVINVSANGVAVKIDDTTIGENVSNQLEVKNNSIDENKLTTSVAGNGLTGGNGAALAAVSDATGGANLSRSIDVNANGIAVKIDGVSVIEGTSNRLEVGTVDGGTF